MAESSWQILESTTGHMTGPTPLRQVKNVADPTDAQDLATKAYVDAQQTTKQRTISANDTLVLTDVETFIDSDAAGAVAVTVPDNASVAFPLGTIVYLTQLGAGALSITAAGGVTINFKADKGLNLDGQFATCMLRKTDTDTWLLTGEVIP